MTPCLPLPCADGATAIEDLGANFFLTEDDVRAGRSRADACVKKVGGRAGAPHVLPMTLTLALPALCARAHTHTHSCKS